MEKVCYNDQFFDGTKKKWLNLSDDYLKVIKWWVGAGFSVCPDFKSRTGAIITLGQGEMQSVSRKKKLNTGRSIEAELVIVGNASV